MSASPAAPRSDSPNFAIRPAKSRIIPLIVASAMLMEQLDGTVLATALPTMARSFHVDPLEMSVALTAYLLSLAVLIPVSGKFADRFGSRTVFRAAIIVFVAGSMLCAVAPSLPFLVVARIVQGTGGAMMVPVGRLVLLRSVPKAELVRAMTWMMIPATMGPILGPPVGGFIVTWLDWRWIFYITVPIGLLGIVMVSRYIEEVREPGPVAFDVVGIVLSGIALCCFMGGFEMIGRSFGSLEIALLLVAAGLVGAVAYVRHAARHPNPVLEFRLMRVSTFRLSVLSGALSRIAVGAMPFLMPMMLQLGFGLSAAQSGLISFSAPVGSLLMRATTVWFLRRLGFRNVLVWFGLAAVATLTATAAFRPSWPAIVVCGILCVGGFFQSLQFIAYNTIAYADIPRARMSAATSFYTTFQQMSLTLGIAFSAMVLAMSVRLTGHAQPELSDFSNAFLAVSAVSAFAPLLSTLLEPSAGAQLSGYRGGARKPVPAE